ncbi:UNVERIFIED_CONTAM: hypothetical protein Sradi_5718800 [Sesamum radiatum]|uniref:Uncharacterized protein n=1 Tax=Sesamum radiatum TaxID=300843 RepID=A0AAW2L4L5_SESRA
MNGLEKSTRKLINMLVQFKVTFKRSEHAVMLGEAFTLKKAQRLDVGRRRAMPKIQYLGANQLSRLRLLEKEIGRRFLKLARQKMLATTAM